jgi:fibronectin type 3 domain-containing protein
VHLDDPATSDIKEYRLYRETPDGKSQLLSSLKPDKTNYIDKTTEKGKSYFYRVSIVNLKGVESEKSDEVGINLP